MKRTKSSYLSAWLAALSLVAGPSLLAADATASTNDRPNILLIVVDDLGFADVGFQGCKDIPTPNIDSLASEGLRFSNGYVTHPFCSPSRAGIMTGRYQQRFGYIENPYYDVNNHRDGVPTNEIMLPEYLRRAGYVTGWIGKWHLGAAPEFRPLNRGFMETFGFLGGGHHYLNWKPIYNPVGAHESYYEPILRNGQPVSVTNHLTIAFGDEGAAFVRRHQHQPWFLYLAFNAPHTPNEPTKERLHEPWCQSIQNPKRRAYAAQVSLLDDAVGHVLDTLRATGQERRTLVFFFSDNGGQVIPKYWDGSSNLPLRAGKGTLYEGGMHVPFVMSWPGTLPAGRTYNLPVSSLDAFATSLAVAGVPMPTNPIHDGVNLIPYLTGANTNAPHNELFWRLGVKSAFAMRDGDMKLVHYFRKPVELYNLANDLGETQNLADADTNQVETMAAAAAAWNDQMLFPPLFYGLSRHAKSPVEP